MSTIPKKVLRKMITDENLKSAGDLRSYLKDLFKDTLQEMLEAELETELGYEKGDRKINSGIIVEMVMVKRRLRLAMEKWK